MPVFLVERVLAGLSEGLVGRLDEVPELVGGGTIDQREEYHLIHPRIDRYVERGEMLFIAHYFVPVEIEFLEELAEAQVVAVFFHHNLRHPHLHVWVRCTQNAALEAIGAEFLAHHVNRDQVQL